jgi:flagellar motor switch protein FliN/FliY
MSEPEQNTIESPEEQQAPTTQGQVMEVDLPEAKDKPSPENAGNIDMLLDMTLPVSVSLGTGHVPINKLLQLGPGSVLQLDRQVGEPADIYIRDTKVATGDVVVVGERFAIRVRHVIGSGKQD